MLSDEALETAGSTVKRSPSDPQKDKALGEEREFHVPDLLSDTGYDANSKAYSAIAQQIKHLHRAEGLLDDAWNLARLMLTSIGDVGDSRAMQTEAGLKAIEKSLREAHAQIDKHHSRYTNLFFAYFDLKEKTEGRVE